MDYNTLLDLAADLGYRLALAGAETFRVEESVNRVLDAYGIQSETFSIPNCLIVSIETAEGKPMTRMRRIGHHGNDLDAVEKYNSISRRICAEKPDPSNAQKWLKATDASRISYSSSILLLGSFLGAFGFSFLFGATFIDGICAGICGLIVGIIGDFLDRLKTNLFFCTVTAAFIMSVPAYALGALGVVDNPDTVIIGALMLLVPGLLFTNAMRDIIFGDTNSGVNRIVQVFLIAAAIALGTAAAWNVSFSLFGSTVHTEPVVHHITVHLLASMIGCIGFSILFNIHGPGGLLCALGGVLSWGVYNIALQIGGNDILAYFFAAVAASEYAEIMARWRKYPAISYLVVSIFPMIPGAGVYYTMTYAVRGDMAGFADQGMHTVAIAGVMAVGILLVSTSVRLWSAWKQHKTK